MLKKLFLLSLLIYSFAYAVDEIDIEKEDNNNKILII